MTVQLVEHYLQDTIHIQTKRFKNTFASNIRELFYRTWYIKKLCKKHNVQYMFGTSVCIGNVSKLAKIYSYNFNEDDDDVVPLYCLTAYPFATKIINPTCLRYKRWKSKRVLVPSYHELAYLHPNNFTPDRAVVEKYGLQPDAYIIVRLSALKAHHDAKAKGISQSLRDAITPILEGYTVIQSLENSKTHHIEPWDMHHVLAHAKMLISDSQTMSMEAAVLGVPSVRCSTFAGKISVLEELELAYGLTFGFQPDNETAIVDKIREILSTDTDTWQQRRAHMLQEKIDFNQWMIEYFETQINA